MIYIIDGYNVMHSMEGDRGIPAGELESKRRRFVESVISQAAASGNEAIIVFDSAASGKPEGRDVAGTAVTVWYASRAESADIVIGKLVKEKLSAGAERIGVVSADWEVQRGVMRDRVERIPPRHFIDDLTDLTRDLGESGAAGERESVSWRVEHRIDETTLRKMERLRRGKKK